jgi:TonB-linked SusC/RagA family outer membrane protein
MQRSWWVGRVLSICAAVGAAVASGQTSSSSLRAVDRGPAFYALSGGSKERIDIRTVAVLQQQIALSLDNASLPDAVDAISKAARTPILYHIRDLSHSAHITLQAATISVAAALRAILADADLDVQVSPSGALTLAVRANPETSADNQPADTTAVVRGTITDASTHAPLVDATVSIERTNRTALTGLDGRYTLGKLPANSYTVVARRIGYVSQRRTFQVEPGATLALDFRLVPSPAVLDQVVVTMTGDQDKRSLGNSIGTIAADSVVALQPVQQLSDVLNARVAGLQVFNSGGLSGASPQVNIRGQNSATLSNQPILYIDGIRIDNSWGQQANQPGRYDDIVPSEIESIQVIRGPSAASLYGTDAANGIILITTKQGETGKPKWDITAENGLLTMDRDRFKESHYSWGHPTGGGPEGLCTIQQVGVGQCTIDSVTTYTPLRDPLQTPIGTGGRQNYIAQVSGGTPTVRYFTSATTDFETGYLKIPEAERVAAEASPAGLTAISPPNTIQKVGIRQTLAIQLNDEMDLSLAGGYVDNRSRIPAATAISEGQFGPGYNDANNGWFSGQTPLDNYEQTRPLDHAQHLTFSGTGNWRPASWLSTRATVGLDQSNDLFQVTEYAGEGGPFAPSPQGGIGQTAATNAVYTVDIGATATTPFGPGFVARTSVGSEYIRQEYNSTSASGGPLELACGSLSCAAQTFSSSSPAQTVILGGYGEEGLSLNDRLFANVGVRVDGSNTFGTSYKAAVYPKANGSWVVSSEPFWPRVPILSTVRLRGGYGESGTQPNPQQALTLYQYSNRVIDGQSVLTATVSQLGNAHLRPERQREYEGGVDVDLFHGRVHSEFTYYDKLSSDALETITLGASIGSPQFTENVGSVRNQGIEGAIAATLLDARALRLDVGLNGSINHNLLVSLGPGIQPEYNPYGFGSLVPGYPLFSVFDHRYSYIAPARSGILEPGDLTLDTAQSYLGQTYPKAQWTFTTTLTVLAGHLRLNMQLDHRDGFVLDNNGEQTRCVLSYCRATDDLHAPLPDQAAAVAYQNYSTVAGYEESGAFTRLREVALTAVLPNQVARAIRARTAEITFAGRNLALWTKYGDVDPEVSNTSNTVNPANGAYQSQQGGIPLATYWIVRLSLGF